MMDQWYIEFATISDLQNNQGQSRIKRKLQAYKEG